LIASSRSLVVRQGQRDGTLVARAANESHRLRDDHGHRGLSLAFGIQAVGSTNLHDVVRLRRPDFVQLPVSEPQGP
jgi:hypothetical protein